MTNPYLKRSLKNESNKGRAGTLAEVKIAKRIGGVLRPCSGALEGAKGDMEFKAKSYKFLMENKSTTGISFSIKRDILFKIYQEALETSNIPALSFQFVDSNGRSEKRERWVCIPEHYFKSITQGDEV